MTTTTAPTAPTLADLTDEELGQLAQLVATDGRQFLGADVIDGESIAREAQVRAETRARFAQTQAEVAHLITEFPAEALASHALEDEEFTQFHESEIELADSELAGAEILLASDAARYEAAAAALLGASPVAEAEAITKEAAPKKRAKKAVCSGSSTYVAHTEEQVVERTAKGRAAYATVECPGCAVSMRAGVWFSEKGIQLRGEEGMAYLSKHTV